MIITTIAMQVERKQRNECARETVRAFLDHVSGHFATRTDLLEALERWEREPVIGYVDEMS